MKKTTWFPPQIKPVRKGVYEVLGDGRLVYFSHWNGMFWGGVSI